MFCCMLNILARATNEVYLAADTSGTGRSFVGSTYPGNYSRGPSGRDLSCGVFANIGNPGFTYLDSALQLLEPQAVFRMSSLHIAIDCS